MAPHWARSVRPLVLIFTAIALLVTVLFRADVDAQAGAYATGVLVLITSAAMAVALSARRSGQRRSAAMFGVLSAILAYTTAMNILERPEGIQIAAFFISGILVVSFASRVVRAFELRVTSVTLDPVAERFIRRRARDPLRILASDPCEGGGQADYRQKIDRACAVHNIPDPGYILLVEVTISDPSDFEAALLVTGQETQGFRVLRLVSPSVPNAIAALLLDIHGRSGTRPHIYFEWSEGNPVLNLIRYLVFGIGEIAMVTHEILRESEPNRSRRPVVHVA